MTDSGSPLRASPRPYDQPSCSRPELESFFSGATVICSPTRVSSVALTAREADMLRLVSEGFDTAEIAAKTSFSERTVKNVLHDVTSRLQLRNRSHAVAYALKQGMI